MLGAGLVTDTNTFLTRGSYLSIWVLILTSSAALDAMENVLNNVAYTFPPMDELNGFYPEFSRIRFLTESLTASISLRMIISPVNGSDSIAKEMSLNFLFVTFLSTNSDAMCLPQYKILDLFIRQIIKAAEISTALIYFLSYSLSLKMIARSVNRSTPKYY